MKFVPHKWQEQLQREILTKNVFGSFAFPGSGKTPMHLCRIYQDKEPTLIIASIDIIYTTWMKEPKKWDFSENLKMKILHGPDKNRAFMENSGVYIINPEGLKWLLDKVMSTKRFPWKTLIVDESIRFKNHKSVQFKCLCKLLKSFKRRYILCGNPVPKGYLDLWAQIYILDLGDRLGTSWYRFRDKYFYPTDYLRFNWKMKPGAKEEIIESISDITMFLDVTGDLPERIVDKRPLTLPAEIRKVYNNMESELFAQLDESINILAQNRGVALMKCWQIANGFLYEHKEDTEDRIVHYMHNELANFAAELVEELSGTPILIAYHFKEDLKRLREKFPNARVAESGISPKEIQSIEEDWNANKIPVLLAYISKFSHGLNLQLGEGHHVMFYCLTYNFDTFDQLIRRFERQGAGYDTVVVHIPYMESTVHEAIIANLDGKKTQSDDFLHSLKEYRSEMLMV